MKQKQRKFLGFLCLAALFLMGALLLTSCGTGGSGETADTETMTGTENITEKENPSETGNGTGTGDPGETESPSETKSLTETDTAPEPGSELEGLLPILYITELDAPLSSVTKEKEQVFRVALRDGTQELFDCAATLKVQGSSSVRYPKKNYTLRLYRDTTLLKKNKVDLFGWGKESKFCLKANYVDFSQARNVVSGDIYGQIARTRLDDSSPRYALPNCGAVDGYPIAVFLNGEFHGLYTFNIPKDKWMFGMSDEDDSRMAILMADGWTDSTYLFSPVSGEYEESGWDLEYCSTSDDDWVRKSMNRLISCLNLSDREELMELLPQYLDIDSAIDVLLLTMMMAGTDNVAKNLLYVTYDGVRWTVSPYDMDLTWGMAWDASHFYDADYEGLIPRIRTNGTALFENGRMQLWNVLFSCYGDRILRRWNELKETCLGSDQIKSAFAGFFSRIPDAAYALDREKWQGIPQSRVDQKNQIYGFIDARWSALNRFFTEWENRRSVAGAS